MTTSNQSVGGELASRYAKHPIVRSLIKLVPGGSTLDSLVAARADEIKKARTRAFFDELATGSIDLSEELVEQEEFLHCLFRTLEAAQRSYRQEKVAMFAKMLKTCCNGDSITGIDQFDELVGDLDALSMREMSSLMILREHELATPMPPDPPDRKAEESDRVMSFWPSFESKVCATLSIAKEEMPSFLARMGRTSLYSPLDFNLYGDHPTYGRTTPQFEKLCKMIA